jgi:hypothetical protein
MCSWDRAPPGADEDAELQLDDSLGGIGSGQIHYLYWEPDAIAVRLYGDVAVIRYQSQLEMVARGRHIPRQRYWHTELYEQRGAQWRIVWSRATAADSESRSRVVIDDERVGAAQPFRSRHQEDWWQRRGSRSRRVKLCGASRRYCRRPGVTWIG